MPEPRCARESLARHEPMLGTAAHARSYLLVEHSGPWPHDAVAESAMPEQVRALLAEYDGKVVLIRRPDRPTGPVHVFEARPGVLTGVVLDHLGALLTEDRELWPALDEPVYLVCTHAKRDPCCALFGRPVVQALAGVHPDRTWEASHLGGHRFAGNLLVLPEGDLFGRVRPETAARAIAGGHPELVRGNCWLAPREQVAAVAGTEPLQCQIEPGRLSCDDPEPSPIEAWVPGPAASPASQHGFR